MAFFSRPITLTKNNQHLLDIFTSNYYLELGNIDPSKLQKLLKKKLVKYSDLAFFEIQNKGIGNSNVNNETLKAKMPYFYFDALVNKKASYQLFITYGIFVQRHGYKEIFTPIILIPVNIYHKEDDLYYQMISSPVLNPLLNLEKHVTDTQLEKLTDIYKLDNFCINLFKQSKTHLRLESYITLAETTIDNAIFSSEKFNLSSLNLNYVESCYNVNVNEPVCQLSPLNQSQRYALEYAHFGNSFAISGILGTGKTRCLENIASDAIFHNKKVLYISNAKESIDEVYNFFYEKNLEYLVKDLTNPFNNRVERKIKQERNQKMIDSITKGELEVKYDGIKDYTKILYDKVNNFYFIDIMEGTIKYRDIYQNYEKETLSGIDNVYRLEAEQIQKALHLIDTNICKLASFKDCKYNNIPIKNEVTKDEVVSFIQKLKEAYKKLSTKKEKLEKDFYFAPISNYAYFRNIIKNYEQIDLDYVPSSWLEFNESDASKRRLPNFEKAKEQFNNLQNDITISEDAFNVLIQEYKDNVIEGIDIHNAIDTILLKFKNKTNEEINNFLKNNKKINDELVNISKSIEECEYNFGKLRDKLGIKISNHDSSLLDSLVSFIDLIANNQIPRLWFDEKNGEGIRNKIVSLKEKLDEYKNLHKFYSNYFTDLDTIDTNIAFLNKKASKKLKYKGENPAPILEKFKKLAEARASINNIRSQFKELTLCDYPTEEDVVTNYDNFLNIFNNIKDEKVKSKIAKSIFTLKDSALEEFLKPFYTFASSYKKIYELSTNLYNDGLISKEKADLPETIKALNNIKQYSTNVLDIQTKMSDLIKRELSYVPYQEYLILANRIDTLLESRARLDNNKVYKALFGKMYNGYLTNVGTINDYIGVFDSYINIFKDNEGIKFSLDEKNRKNLSIILKDCYQTCEEANELIKDYTKIFRDSITKFFYEDMDSNIEYLNSYLSSPNELNVYLTVCEGMKVLLQYKLYEFNRYIVNHDREKFEDKFMNAFYKHLYQKFLSTHNQLMNSEGYNKLLDDIKQWEIDICNNNIEKLKITKPYKGTGPNLKGINYETYINRAIDTKHLFLANSQIMNLFLDATKFDLVLVDDAHLLTYEHYATLLNANQVIFAGVNDIRVSITNDVFSKLKKNQIIDFKNRIPQTPRVLLKNINRAVGNFYSEEFKNDGFVVVNDSCFDEIIKLIMVEEKDTYHLNKNIKINCYYSNLGKIKEIYDHLGEYLTSKGISEKEVFEFITHNLNICDLRLAYDLESNYNIIDISDYYEEHDEYEKNNLIAHLLCTKQAVIVVDELGLLQDLVNYDDNKYPMLKELRGITETTDVIIPITDPVCLKIAAALKREKGINILGKYRNNDIIFRKDGINYGVILLVAPSKYDTDILNVYRENSTIKVPSSIIFLNDLITDFDQTINKILRDTIK